MKKFRLLLALLLVGLFACVCIACDRNRPEPEGPAFTVKILDVDGTPCTWIDGIQACRIAEGDTPGACFGAIGAVNEQGVAVLDYGDNPLTHLTDRSCDHVEIHLVGLPETMTFDTLTMYKGETKTIQLRYKTDADLDQPESGNGTAVYLEDTEGDLDISEENFKPYAVTSPRMYRLRFATANEKIYFAFSATMAYDYEVKVLGGLNVKITQLVGDTTNGISNDGDATKSVSGVDCSYEFTTEEATDVVYFEISLLDAEQITVDGYISFGFAV